MELLIQRIKWNYLFNVKTKWSWNKIIEKEFPELNFDKETNKPMRMVYDSIHRSKKNSVTTTHGRYYVLEMENWDKINMGLMFEKVYYESLYKIWKLFYF
jgi:hypothetical protein